MDKWKIGTLKKILNTKKQRVVDSDDEDLNLDIEGEDLI